MQWWHQQSSWSALAGAIFDQAMDINIELLMDATGPPHFTHHYYVRMRSRDDLFIPQAERASEQLS